MKLTVDYHIIYVALKETQVITGAACKIRPGN